jgi:uncharacterized CHY-type Zn-finger protein
MNTCSYLSGLAKLFFLGGFKSTACVRTKQFKSSQQKKERNTHTHTQLNFVVLRYKNSLHSLVFFLREKRIETHKKRNEKRIELRTSQLILSDCKLPLSTHYQLTSITKIALYCSNVFIIH